MHCQTIDNNRIALLGGKVAKSLNENQDGNGLVVAESRVDGAIHVIRVYRDIGRDDRMEGGRDRGAWYVVANMSQLLEDFAYLGGLTVVK
jgi:hypothetical protein